MVIEDNNYINSVYSGDGLLVSSICDIIIKILMLVLIGFLYDCVSYTILKKV